MNEILRAIEAEQIRTDLPEFHVGDNVKLHVKVKEGNRERIQMFEGTVIKRQNGGLRETFTAEDQAYRLELKELSQLTHQSSKRWKLQEEVK